MRIKAVSLLVIAAAALTACTNEGVKSASDNWGEANRQTMMAQVIDPDPQYDTINPVTSGDHAAKAVDRYNKGSVKQPDKVRTSTLGSSGSGGSSGGGN